MWGHPRSDQQLGSFLACWLSRNEVAMNSSLWEVCRPEKPVESQCRGFLCPHPISGYYLCQDGADTFLSRPGHLGLPSHSHLPVPRTSVQDEYGSSAGGPDTGSD